MAVLGMSSAVSAMNASGERRESVPSSSSSPLLLPSSSSSPPSSSSLPRPPPIPPPRPSQPILPYSHLAASSTSAGVQSHALPLLQAALPPAAAVAVIRGPAAVTAISSSQQQAVSLSSNDSHVDLVQPAAPPPPLSSLPLSAPRSPPSPRSPSPSPPPPSSSLSSSSSLLSPPSSGSAAARVPSPGRPSIDTGSAYLGILSPGSDGSGRSAEATPSPSGSEPPQPPPPRPPRLQSQQHSRSVSHSSASTLLPLPPSPTAPLPVSRSPRSARSPSQSVSRVRQPSVSAFPSPSGTHADDTEAGELTEAEYGGGEGGETAEVAERQAPQAEPPALPPLQSDGEAALTAAAAADSPVDAQPVLDLNDSVDVLADDREHDSAEALADAAPSQQSALAPLSSPRHRRQQSSTWAAHSSASAAHHHRRRSSFRHHMYLDEELSREDSGTDAQQPQQQNGAAAVGTGAEELSCNGSVSSSGSGGGQTSASSSAEQRVDVSDAVKLSSILSLQQRRVENRFVNDWVPLPPPHVAVESLVAAAISQFTRPIKQVVRRGIAYRRVAAKRVKLLPYECDEPVKARARLELARAAAKRGQLQDIFTQPTAEAAAAAAPAASSSSFASPSSPGSGSSKAYLDLDDGRYEALGSAEELVDLSLFTVLEEDVAAAIRREQSSSSRSDGLFWRFAPEYEYDEAQSAELQIRRPVSFWTAAQQLQAALLLVSVQSLRFSLGSVEPFFCSLALYDLKDGLKCSEDFHFDLNDASLLTGQIAVETQLADPLTLCKHAVFSLTSSHLHDALQLVLKVERVLQGDPADMEVYLKSKQRTAQELQQLSKRSRANLVHLAEYRQPFCWGMLPLFDSSGALRHTHNSVRMERLFLQPESLKDELFIATAREVMQDGGKRLKQLPASYFECRIDALQPDALPANRVDPSCIPLKSTAALAPLLSIAETNSAPDAQSSRTQPQPAAPPAMVKEVLDFTSSTLPIPANGFVNLLYVYPESVRFDKYRNICCRVQVRSNDSSLEPAAAATAGAGAAAAPDVHKVIVGKVSSPPHAERSLPPPLRSSLTSRASALCCRCALRGCVSVVHVVVHEQRADSGELPSASGDDAGRGEGDAAAAPHAPLPPLLHLLQGQLQDGPRAPGDHRLRRAAPVPAPPPAGR